MGFAARGGRFAPYRGKPGLLLSRQRREARGAFDADCNMTEVAESLQIATRAATQVENRKGRFAFDGVEQRRDVLTDVVRARALPESVGALVVMLERAHTDGFELGSRSLHRLQLAWVRIGAGLKSRLPNVAIFCGTGVAPAYPSPRPIRPIGPSKQRPSC